MALILYSTGVAQRDAKLTERLITDPSRICSFRDITVSAIKITECRRLYNQQFELGARRQI